MRSKYSIHTFEIVCDLGISDYKNFLGRFFQLSKIEKLPVIPFKGKCSEGYNFICLKSKGINTITFKEVGTDEGIFRRQVCFKVNPRRLLNIQTHPYICIIPPERLREIPEQLDGIIQEVCKGFPSVFLYGRIDRIDYCCNIKLESPKRAKKYLNLLRKGYFANHFTPVMEYDLTEKRKTFGNGRLRLKSTYYTFEIYLKGEQMKQSKYYYDEDEIEEAESQIRIELRAEYRKLVELRKKYGTITEAEFLCESPTIAEKELHRLLTNMYGHGDFHSIKKAKEIIANSSYRFYTKEKMLKIVDTASSQKSLTKAFDILNIDSGEKRRYFEYFNKLCDSPVTFGKPGCFYRNPLFYIDEYNANYD